MPSPLVEGAIFAGRYRIVRCIAEGGMGAVYEVIHLETERRRALKVMLPHILHSQELRDRFKREARVAAQVDSEFIVDVFDAGHDEPTGMPFLVMELLRGEELGRRLSRVGRFSPQETVTFLHQTALALDKTHKASIVHRDLKPENLFLTQREDGSGRIKVLDFGIAKLVAEGNTQANATRSLGTPLYMAPEQFNTGTRVSPSTDIYALGMIAYTFLVGRHYWFEETKDEGNVFAFAVTAMQGPQEAATARAARFGVQLPPAFDEWFRRVTNRDAAQRFQIASAAIVELAEVLGVAAPTGSHISVPPMATQPLGVSGGKLAQSGSTGISASITNGEAAAKKRGAPFAVGFGIAATVILLGVGGFVLFGRTPAASAPAAPPETAAPTAVAAPAPSAEPSSAPTAAPTALAEPAASTSATAEPTATSVKPATKPVAVAKPAAPAKPTAAPAAPPPAQPAAAPAAPKPAAPTIYGRD